MTSYAAGDTCPQCNYPIPASHPSLCPNCQYPLLFEETDDNLEAVANEQLRRPSRETVPDQTMINPRVRDERPVVQSSQPVGETRPCPICGWANSLSRARCERCSAVMRTESVEAALPPPPAPPPKPSRTWILIPVAIALAAVLGTGTYFGLRAANPPSTTGASPSPTATAPTQVGKATKISSKSIKAKASSTLPKDRLGSYGLDKTLDGNVKTAWNSDGEKAGADAEGVTLTYTFSSPVTITKIAFANGFQKDEGAFARNGRIKSMIISAGDQESPVDLTDDLGRQTYPVQLGQSTTLTMTITGVYRDKTKYKDLALSEVEFTGFVAR